ncbi:MAG: ATP-binding cassette domain-containing protein [Treponema sp.]|jgi:iron(III) transport system ATP-binding protein|nr:ATP-binding cassette domain-containing protein [Treponema sp.]
MSHLRIENVTKKYGVNTVLQNINLEINKGEFLCVLGPSGCGKTTLLRVLAGLENIETGGVYINNKDVTVMPPAKRNFGIVFQSYALFPNLTVYQNIAYGLSQKKNTKNEIREKVEDIIKIVNLTGHEGKYPQQLSGGQQQRVALARAIVLDPEFLLLDEPLSALDAKVRMKLRREVKNLQKRLGITTIMVTHDQEEALSMADRIVVMNNAIIEQVGIPEEIYEMPRTNFVADFIGTVNFLDGSNYAIRPENVALDSKGEISGKIIDIEYRGAFYRLLVDSRRGLLTVDVKADVRKRIKFEQGLNVFVNIPMENVISFNREAISA